LWDDPLFNPDANEFLELAKNEEAWAIEKRREMTLHTLDLLHQQIDEGQCRFWWLWRRAQQYLPEEVRMELVTVIRDGKTIDPEFTFRKELDCLEAHNSID
jgi:hypothetical protein